MEGIETFTSEEDLDEKLDSFVADVLNEKVSIDLVQGEMLLPKILQTYRDDFGNSDEEIIKFVFRYYKSSEVDEETVIRDVCQRKSLLIRYE